MAGHDDIRWGILGAGRIARAFAQDVVATAGNRVETIAARDPARADRLRDSVGAARTSPSYQALLEDPAVDVVYIATVNSVHREQALLALDAGKNVLIEKPLAMTAAEARDIASRAAAAGRFCMEGMWMRMHPLVLQAQSLVAAGAIGDLLGIHAELSSAHAYAPEDRLFDLATGGGAALDLGVYPAHFAYRFMGSPASVAGSMTFAPNGADDGIAMQWTYPDGRFAQLHSSFRGPSAMGGIIRGTAGYLHLGPRINRPRELTLATLGTTLGAGQSAPETRTADSPGNGFGFEIAEVARCVRDGLTQSPLAPLNDSIAVLHVLDEVRKANVLVPANAFAGLLSVARGKSPP